jgi:hypothetical protein
VRERAVLVELEARPQAGIWRKLIDLGDGDAGDCGLGLIACNEIRYIVTTCAGPHRLILRDETSLLRLVCV